MQTSLLAPLLLLAAALAGCSGDGDGGTSSTEDPAPVETDLPALHGWVLDPAIRPLSGATVTMLETNQSATTDGDGFYAFPEAPREELLVLVASMDGFRPGSKQVTVPPDLPVRLNFTLEPIPVKTASSEVLNFAGFLSCQGAVEVSEQRFPFDCSGGTGQANVWEFAAGADLAGAVIEVAWDAGTPAAEDLTATLETLGLGDFNFVLGEVVGASPLRISVPNDVAMKYYPSGGLMRLTVASAPATDEEEAGTGASFAFQQDFQAFASLFYVEPPSPTYSFVTGQP